MGLICHVTKSGASLQRGRKIGRDLEPGKIKRTGGVLSRYLTVAIRHLDFGVGIIGAKIPVVMDARSTRAFWDSESHS